MSRPDQQPKIMAQYRITLFESGEVELGGGPTFENFPLFRRVMCDVEMIVLRRMMKIKAKELKKKGIEVVSPNIVTLQ